MKNTIGEAMLLTKHMTAAVRLKRRLAAHDEAQRKETALGDALSNLGDRLKDALGKKFKTERLLPEGIEAAPDSDVVEGIIPLDKVPPGLKELLDKLASGGIEGASVRISELNPDGSVKQQKIIGDPSDFGEAPDKDVPRH